MNIWVERGVLFLGGIAAGAIVTHILERRRFVDLECRLSKSLEELYTQAKKKDSVVEELEDLPPSYRIEVARELEKKYGEKNPYEQILEDVEKSIVETLDMSIPGDDDEEDDADVPYQEEDDSEEDNEDDSEEDDEDDEDTTDDDDPEDEEDSVPFDLVDPENTIAEVGPNGRKWRLNRNDKRIFVISLEEFMSNDNYQQAEILYSPSRNKFYDNESEEIDDVEMYIGKGNLFWGFHSNDKNVVYIRNKDLRTDFEVIRENEVE
jgi:hypothetical protein